MEPEPGVVGEAMDFDCPPAPGPSGASSMLSQPMPPPQPVDSGSTGEGVEALLAARDAARTVWERANLVTDASDEHLKYDMEVHQSIVNAKPWDKDPHYFKSVKVSAIALLKMLIHAHSGGTCEVMGLLIGKVAHETMIVVDVAPLPVKGTETRVNAQSEAYEYIVAYKDLIPHVGRTENVLGWYHSHPGYGCWLSGIDVATQHLNQTYQEPFVAIVVDPTRTVSYGKVNLDAFRTYPEGYKPLDEAPSEYQSIPMEKIEDFGVHCKRYYSLDVSYFKSSLENQIFNVMWNRYWVNTLSSSNTIAQSNHITNLTKDLAEKVENAATTVPRMNSEQVRFQEKLAKCSKDASKMVLEQMNSLIGQLITDSLFKTS